MLFKPQANDFRIIAYHAGKVIIGLAYFMLAPIVIAILTHEFNPLLDFITSFFCCMIVGLALNTFCCTKEEPKWNHGMIIVALSWVVAAFSAALPLFLSGHFESFLDAVFESVSGLTTTGFSLAQDLAHMSYAHNFWRHFILFIGGQGMVVVILSIIISGASGSFRLYVGEGRDERLLPNLQHTAQFIWVVSCTYLVLGSIALAISLMSAGGMTFFKALFHGACIFMAAFDTGGFGPQGQNMMYYHNLSFEIIACVCMIIGAINFQVHYMIWNNRRKEAYKDVEMATLFIITAVIFGFIAYGLSHVDAYHGVMALFRKGFFQLISAQTTTGFQTIYSQQFVHEWGSLPMLGLIVAMAIGGSMCSTTGGIKVMRIAIIAKAFTHDVKQLGSPEKMVFFKKMHHVKDVVLTEKMMRAACMTVIAYMTVYFLGGLIGMACGYPFIESFFESTSAVANVGLSCGIVSPDMPQALKITYILQMWSGRLEFMSVMVLIGFCLALLRGK